MDESGTEKPTGWRLQEAIRSSRGMIFVGRMEFQRFSRYIFMKNSEQLTKAIVYFENPDHAKDFWAEENRNGLHRFHSELHRYLHNYLSSVMLLVDHTRSFIEDDYARTEVQLAYDAVKNETFSNNPLHRFTQDLRNFMLHHRLPVTRLSYVWNGSKIELDLVALKQWSGWKSLSSQYLENLNRDIRLKALVEDYTGLVSKFHDWMIDLLCAHHKEDLDEFRNLRELYEGRSLKEYSYREMLEWFR